LTEYADGVAVRKLKWMKQHRSHSQLM